MSVLSGLSNVFVSVGAVLTTTLALGNQLVRASPQWASCCRRVVSCVHFSIAIRQSLQMFCDVLGPYLYCCWSLVPFWALFVAMSGFLMAVSCWRHRLQCIVIVRSFLRLLKLHTLAVRKLDLLRRGSYSVSRHVRPWIKLTLEYPFKYICLILPLYFNIAMSEFSEPLTYVSTAEL